MGQEKLPLDIPIEYRWAGMGEACDRKGWLYRACPSLKHFTRFPNSCHRRDCPTHWRDWLEDEARAVGKRFERFRGLNWSQVFQHVVVSLYNHAELPGTASQATTQRKRVYSILKAVGVTGGAVCLHPARVHTNAEYEDAEAEGGAHWHGVVTGWIDYTKVRALSERTGAVIKGLGNSRGTPRQIARYMLSHCVQPVLILHIEGSRKDRPAHCLTWFGELSYNKLPTHEIDHDGVYCCGCREAFLLRDWVRIEWRGLDRPPPDTETGKIIADDWHFSYPDERERSYCAL